MATPKSWEEERAEGYAEGWAEGYAEGRAEARRNSVLIVLRVRGIEVSDATRERIVKQNDLEQLKRWLESAVVASSIGEVIDDPT